MKVLKKFGAPEQFDLFAKVGEGTATPHEILATVYPDFTRDEAAGHKPLEIEDIKIPGADRKKKLPTKAGVPLRGLIPGMAVHYARCCHPLPGDRIVGIVTTGKGVTVHTIDCDTLESFSDQPERWIDISWDMPGQDRDAFVGRLHAVLVNSPSTMGSLTTVIGKNNANITNMQILNRTNEFFEVIVDVEVGNVKHLTEVIAALRASPDISSVDRLKR